MNAPTRIRYPTARRIAAEIASARRAGIDVGGYEVRPDGTIRVFDVRSAAPSLAGDDFARLDAAGML